MKYNYNNIVLIKLPTMCDHLKMLRLSIIFKQKKTDVH